jgi:hypothetical protein
VEITHGIEWCTNMLMNSTSLTFFSPHVLPQRDCYCFQQCTLAQAFSLFTLRCARVSCCWSGYAMTDTFACVSVVQQSFLHLRYPYDRSRRMLTAVDVSGSSCAASSSSVPSPHTLVSSSFSYSTTSSSWVPILLNPSLSPSPPPPRFIFFAH